MGTVTHSLVHQFASMKPTEFACDDRAEVAGGGSPRQGGPYRGREATVDTARRSARHLLDRRDALRLRRIHPARDLSRDVARDTFEALAARSRLMTWKGPPGPLPQSLTTRFASTSSRRA